MMHKQPKMKELITPIVRIETFEYSEETEKNQVTEQSKHFMHILFTLLENFDTTINGSATIGSIRIL